MLAARLSKEIGLLSEVDVARVITVCERVNLPVRPPQGMTPVDFMKHMAVDKKNVDGQLRLVLMRSLGEAYVEDHVPAETLLDVLNACCH